MAESTPEYIARCLLHDLGSPTAGIRYCQRAIVRDSPLWPKYQQAAEILRKQFTICAACDNEAVNECPECGERVCHSCFNHGYQVCCECDQRAYVAELTEQHAHRTP